MKIQPYLKALYGSAAAGLGALQVAYADNVLSTQDGIGIAIAVVAAFGIIWGVPNKTAPSA